MAFETPEERQQALQLLQMAQLAAKLGGASLDDELQQLIGRALEEDESVDLEDLLERVNNQLPSVSFADPASWTFNDGLRASCEYFSIAIPDGFRVLTNYDDGFMTRPFVAVPEEVADKDIPTADRLACGGMPTTVLSEFDEHGIDELAIATLRSSMNTNDFGSSVVPEDWVVQGKNCAVLITRVDNGCTGYEYWIRPAILQTGYYLRCIFNNSDADQAEEAREALTIMAKSIEATPPIESKLTRQLKKIGTEKVSAQEFAETVVHLHGILKVCLNQAHEANRAQYLKNAEQPNSYGLAKACALGLEAFFNRVWPLFLDLEQAVLTQKEKHATEAELRIESDILGDAFSLFLVKYLADSKGSAEFFREHGPIARPSGYPRALTSAARFCKGKYGELSERLKQNEKELQKSIRQHINDPEETYERPARDDKPVDDAREHEPGDVIEDAACDEPETAIAEDAACDGPDAGTYDEPGGVDYPAFIMTLLSDDWFFFKDDEITWDGHHHAIAGAQLNGAKVDGFLGFVNSCIPGFDDANEVFQYFVTLLNEIEKDEGLIVPRAMIAPGVQQAIREGDLTGLTLANLAACGRAFSVEKVKPGVYRVIFDGRLIAGIPRFLDLVARLVWDLRQCTNSMRGKPFEISFLQARNIDADQYLGSVDVPVPGAQEYAMLMKVTEAPAIQLPSANDAEAYQGQASVELSPEDDMALGFVRATARNFPLTFKISGTHHMGRAARIEHVNVGDRLILAADWNCPFFDPVAIEVFNEHGETLGYLEAGIGPERGALALMLPYVTATAASVTPLSKRSRGAKYALMDVRLELDDDATVEGTWNVDPSNELLAEARRLACLPKDKRVAISRGNISISQLKGHIDVSGYAADGTPVPAPSAPDRTSAPAPVAPSSTSARKPSAAAEPEPPAELEPGIPAPTPTPKQQLKPLRLNEAPHARQLDINALEHGDSEENDETGEHTLDIMRRLLEAASGDRIAETVKRSRSRGYLMENLARAKTLAERYNFAFCELANLDVEAIERHLDYATSDEAIKEMIACARAALQHVTRELTIPKSNIGTFKGLFVPPAVKHALDRIKKCEQRFDDETDRRATMRHRKVVLRHQKELDESSGEIKELYEKLSQANDECAGRASAFESAWDRAKPAARQAKMANIVLNQALELSNHASDKVRSYALEPGMAPERLEPELAAARDAMDLGVPLRALLRNLSIMRASSRRLLELASDYTEDDLAYLGIDLSVAKERARYLDADTARGIVAERFIPVMGATAETAIATWLELKRDQLASVDLGPELEQCRSELDELATEQSGLGFFAFGRKKSIAAQIAVLQARINALEQAAEHEASLQAQDLDALEQAAVDALKQELGDAASELASMDEFLMHPDLA